MLDDYREAKRREKAVDLKNRQCVTLCSLVARDPACARSTSRLLLCCACSHKASFLQVGDAAGSHRGGSKACPGVQ